MIDKDDYNEVLNLVMDVMYRFDDRALILSHKEIRNKYNLSVYACYIGINSFVITDYYGNEIIKDGLERYIEIYE